jgi:PAS domain S-box-containing protein
MFSVFTPLRERLLRSHCFVALIGLALIVVAVAVDAGIAVVVILLVAAWVATLIVREDEIGVLTRAFNRMRASVAAAERALTGQAAEATRAHAALQAEFLERTQIEAMFRQLLEATPDAILIVDPHGTIALANPASERLFGYRRDELVGGALDRVVPAALESAHLLAGSAADAERAASEPELLALRPDGSRVPVEIRANPFVIDDRTLLAIAVRDVTERHRAAQALRELNAELEQRVLDRTAELRRSNEELERFAAIASHDLQEPLRMVASYTRLLGERYRGRLDADADEFIGYAVDGVQRMQRLVRDLLAYARVSSRAYNPEPTDAEPIFERAIANLRLAIAESGAVIAREPLPCVRVDASQLGQLLQNLIDNALKCRADRPLRVHVSAERTREGWVFSVRDNGVGIAPQDAERVFALFARVHRERALPGSGIGLALCKKIVERHGGRIWIEGLEEGAVVRFTLPAVPEDEARRPLRDRPAARAVTVDQRAARAAGVRA